MYTTTPILIGLDHPLYDFCDRVTHAANNMYNASIFYQRQCITGLPKEPNKRFDLENEVIDLISANLDKMNQEKTKKDGTLKKTRGSKEKDKNELKYVMPTAERPWLSYGFLNQLFLTTSNPDYRCSDLGTQSCQNVVKEAAQQFKNYRSAVKEYRKNPSGFTGKPNFPGYLKKGGMHTLTLSNDECIIRTGKEIEEVNKKRTDENRYRSGLTKKDKKTGNKIDYLPANHAFLKLPKTNLICDLGPADRLDLSNHRLMEVKIIPHHGVFSISVTLGSCMEKKTFEQQNQEREERKKKQEAKKNNEIPELPEGTPLRACSLDLGVDNLVAMTNNIGAQCLLFKGLGIKSVNQYYNKRIAEIVSEQTKGTTNKFVPTLEYQKITLRRNNQISDFMHKTAKSLISWCIDHDINTIVIGHNVFWKQESDMGSRNNQNFVQIPFNKLVAIITYLAERHGIRIIEQEESYTSKASFLDRDPIPVYDKNNDTEYTFSGVRGPKEYHGHKKVQAIDHKTGKRKTSNPNFRGLYKAGDGTTINSDLNGSANIGRKAIANMYDDGIGVPPDFSNVCIIRFPDQENVEKNRLKQREAFRAAHPIRKSTSKHRLKKAV